MSRGVSYTKHLDLTQTKEIYEQSVENWDFLYKASTTKDSRFDIGDRVCLPDGRVFRYGKASGSIDCDLGCKFAEDEVQTYDTTVTAIAPGDTSVTVDGGTHAALTEDELRGGYVIVYHTGGGGYTQFRGIVGNDVADANADFTVYVDASFDYTAAVGTGIEVFYNPYAKLVDGSSAAVTCSVAGRPAINATDGQYFWVQTWGPTWVAPTNASFADANDRGAYWRHSGAIEGEIANASKNVGENSTQYAGFLINEGFTTGPLFMLQVSP